MSPSARFCFSGYLDVAAIISQHKPSARIIVTSGYFDTSTRDRARQRGVAKVIQKPYDPEDLARVIRELLDES